MGCAAAELARVELHRQSVLQPEDQLDRYQWTGGQLQQRQSASPGHGSVAHPQQRISRCQLHVATRTMLSGINGYYFIPEQFTVKAHETFNSHVTVQDGCFHGGWHI